MSETRCKHLGYIYFIRCDSDPVAIKIGWSRTYPTARLASLQGACPHPLSLAGFIRGHFDDERSLHQHFGNSRLHHEWFSPTSDLVSLIETHGKTISNSRCPFLEEIDAARHSLKKKDHQAKLDAQSQKMELRPTTERVAIDDCMGRVRNLAKLQMFSFSQQNK